MIDVENEIFTIVAGDLRERFPGVSVEGEKMYSPSKMPCVCFQAVDNYSHQASRDSGSTERHAVVTFEVNAYSNKSTGKKQECKDLIGVVDVAMTRLGFTRLAMMPVNRDQATEYRICARYSAVVSENHTIYRR